MLSLTTDDKQKEPKIYKPSEKEKSVLEFLDNREKELKKGRKNVFGVNIDELMKKADEDCTIKECLSAGDENNKTKVLVEDENLGWRGTSHLVNLDNEEWRSNNASNEPYIKLMIALSVLFDNNPKAFMEPGGKKFLATTEIFKQLYERSWIDQQAREQLKAFIFNLGKYGFAFGRTFIKQESRTINEIIEYNPLTRESKEEEKQINDFASVIRKNLDPHKVWVDDKAKANDRSSINDWMWEEEYGEDQFEADFGDTRGFEFVEKGGYQETPDESTEETEKKLEDKKTYRVQFYENRLKDRFIARIKCKNGWVLLVNDPLPYDHKELSLWTTFWNLRHPETIYGVSPIEIMRGDKKLKNKIKNMTIDQIVLSIYKMGIMEDKAKFGNQSAITIKPNKIIEGAKVNWLEVPGPGQDAKFAIDFIQSELDYATGITAPLIGEVTGKTAFEIGQAKEAALKRLKLPLDNISFALSCEALLTVDLIYQAYTIPLVEHLVDSREIEEYRKEVDNNPDFYSVLVNEKGEGSFYTKRYKEFSLAVKKDDNGMFIPSGEDKFFYSMPSFIRWKGDIRIDASSMLSTWKEIEKSQTVELGNLVLQYLQIPQEVGKKPLMKILEKWKENPKDWLPDSWLEDKPTPEQNLANKGAEMFGQENLPGNMMPTKTEPAVSPEQPMESIEAQETQIPTI